MDFDLKQLAGMLLKRWWIILLCALLCAGLFYSYTVLYVTPMYTTSTMLMVSTQNRNYTGLNTAEAFVPTYSALLRSAAVLEETAESLGLENDVSYSPGAIAGMLSVSATEDTGIFYISITCANREHAPIIANKVAEIAVPHVVEIADGNKVNIISPATSAYQSSPNVSRNTIYGALLGCVLACGLLILFELLDTAIKSEDDLKEISDEIPIIGIIPTVNIPVTAGVRSDKRTA